MASFSCNISFLLQIYHILIVFILVNNNNTDNNFCLFFTKLSYYFATFIVIYCHFWSLTAPDHQQINFKKKVSTFY